MGIMTVMESITLEAVMKPGEAVPPSGSLELRLAGVSMDLCDSLAE